MWKRSKSEKSKESNQDWYANLSPEESVVLGLWTTKNFGRTKFGDKLLVRWKELISRLKEHRMNNQPAEVFLGGACNPTTWRKDKVIPALEAAGITYFNPQVDHWSPESVEVEARAKQESVVVFFVISKETAGIASMVEASEIISSSSKKVVLVVEDIDPDSPIGPPSIIKDLLRGRAYLKDVAKRHGVEVDPDIESGLQRIIR